MSDAAARQAVLVTGAAGFIGGHAVEAFGAAGWRVFALVHRRQSERLARLARAGAVEIFQGDCADAASVQAILGRCGAAAGTPPVIVHCAGRATDVGRDAHFRRANFESVCRLGEAVRRGQAERLVFVSSTDVYGLLDHDHAAEDTTPLRAVPENPYPRYKIMAEGWLREHLPPAQWSTVRPAAVWGPGDTTISARVVSFLRWSPFILHLGRWRGRNRWPLAHVRNVASALLLAAAEPAAFGQAINVLDREVSTVDEVYRFLGAIYLPGKRFRTLCLPIGLVWPFAAAVSGLSCAFDLDRPCADPSLYALHTVSRNLSFSNARWLRLMERANLPVVTRDEGFAELARLVAGQRSPGHPAPTALP